MKSENTQKVICILEKSIDAEKGFRTAFENATDKSLKIYFFEKSQQRVNFVRELEFELAKIDETADETSGSITGDLHRTWMDVKFFMSADGDHAMLEEALRGENAAKEDFEKVLDEKYLKLELRNILSKQYEIIQQDIEMIKSLEDVQNNFY